MPPRPIDVHHLGRPRVICCWQVDGALVDPGPASTLDTLLAALGGEEPRRLLLTHVHLDHAGAAGTLVRRFPDLEVWVSERGARHLLDPSRLVASAQRLYGDEMERLWGEVLPVPEANVVALAGGESREGFRVAYAPGHASHHVAYLHEESGVALVGDVAGVRVDAGGLVLLPTPPPDVDLDAWSRSLDVLEGWAPEALGLTHFGGHDDVEEHLARVRACLARWGDLSRRTDGEGYAAALGAAIAGGARRPTAGAYEQAMPAGQQWPGLERYWSRRAT